MDKTLWKKVVVFSFDNPNDEYGFSTRLALENHWTLYFTQSAMLEYKKFMFLAATNNEMVSPSEIVDIVWHQHLIFTNSYSDFCNLVGKRIEHIPSTHNRSEFDKFQIAKERTKELYELNFGSQPAEIWHYNNEFDSLQLEKSNYDVKKLRKNFLKYTLIASFPVCLIIYSLLIKIQNPYFIIGYLLLFVAAFLLLKYYVRNKFNSLYINLESNAIIENLTALELVYFRDNSLDVVIHGVVNKLIERNKIKILENSRLELIDENLEHSPYENCIIEIMKEFEPMPYKQLCWNVRRKPIFEQLQNATYRIKDRIIGSKSFTNVMIVAMITLGVLLSIGFSRLFSGFWRDKPVIFLLIALVPLVFITRYYLNQLLNLIFIDIIPSSFKEKVLGRGESKRDWEWDYFLYGTAMLSTAFIPIVNYASPTSSSSGDYFSISSSGNSGSCGSSCGSSGSSGSSCSSSCGSSCGGCGGD